MKICVLWLELPISIGSAMSKWIFFCVSMWLVAAPTRGGEVNIYRFPHFDMSDPSCKIAISRFLDLDDQLLSIISTIFPHMATFARKYKPKDYKRKRDIIFSDIDILSRAKRIVTPWKLAKLLTNESFLRLLNVVNDEFVRLIFGKLGNAIGDMGPCFKWLKGYIIYWVQILTPILTEQNRLFFDV